MDLHAICYNFTNATNSSGEECVAFANYTRAAIEVCYSPPSSEASVWILPIRCYFRCDFACMSYTVPYFSMNRLGFFPLQLNEYCTLLSFLNITFSLHRLKPFFCFCFPPHIYSHSPLLLFTVADFDCFVYIGLGVCGLCPPCCLFSSNKEFFVCGWKKGTHACVW